MKLTHKIEIIASLVLDEGWIDDEAVEGLTLDEIKKLGLELIQEDLVEFFENAKWSVSIT